MDFRIQIDIEKISRCKWREFVLGHPQGNVFQTPDMYDLFQATKNYQPFTAAVLDKFEKIVGIVNVVVQRENPGALGYFSSRAVVWGGPLVDGSSTQNSQIILDCLLEAMIAKLKNKSIYIQFRNLFDLNAFSRVFARHGFKQLEHLNYIVETNDANATMKRISKSKVRQIKKSLEAGAKIIEPESLEQVKEFYGLLSHLYKTKVKMPLPDWSFFENFYELSKRALLGKYFLIEYQDEIIGGIMCPITPNKYIYEWYVCGLDQKYKEVFPSILATWAPIAYANANGIAGFDFLGAGKPDKDYGVREFKSKFGGGLVAFGRFERINHPLLHKMGKIGIQLLSKI